MVISKCCHTEQTQKPELSVCVTGVVTRHMIFYHSSRLTNQNVKEPCCHVRNVNRCSQPKGSTHGIENLKMYVPADMAGRKVAIEVAIPSHHAMIWSYRKITSDIINRQSLIIGPSKVNESMSNFPMETILGNGFPVAHVHTELIARVPEGITSLFHAKTKFIWLRHPKAIHLVLKNLLLYYYSSPFQYSMWNVC